MYRKDGIERYPAIAALRRWIWVLLCVLIAFSAMLQSAQAVPGQVNAGAIQFVVIDDKNGPCEPGHDSTNGHCHMTTTCSPSAALELSPATFLEAMTTHTWPQAIAIHVSRSITPRLQPPQLALDA
jgi:hypothetical protein